MASEALLVGVHLAYAQRAHIADIALRKSWPAFPPTSSCGRRRADGLRALTGRGPMLLADFAAMAAVTLRGANPATTPVEQPS